MSAFSELLIAELALVLVLALLLFGIVHPTPWLHIFRGGESAVPLAFIISIINAIAVVANPGLLNNPNIWLAGLGSLSVIFVCCLLGARIIHFLRPSHKKANLKQQKLLVKSLKDQGMTESEINELINEARSRTNESNS